LGPTQTTPVQLLATRPEYPADRHTGRGKDTNVIDTLGRVNFRDRMGFCELALNQ